MTTLRKILYFAVAFLVPCGSLAQTAEGEFAIKANAQIGLGDVLSITSDINGLTGKSSGDEYGVDFGWRFWHKDRHSLEINIGVGYSGISTRLSVGELNYNYSAPAYADMDGESYQRFTEITDLNQKCRVSRLTVPLYFSYGFRCAKVLRLHADLGVRFGLKSSAKLTESSGQAYTYGVYPQYDNLMINAEYMNDFGNRDVTENETKTPDVSAMTVSLLGGIGAEFTIYGPLSADLSLRYDAGFSNIYNHRILNKTGFTAESAPLTYAVNEGTKVKCLTDYLSSSKLSQCSLNISLIYRF